MEPGNPLARNRKRKPTRRRTTLRIDHVDGRMCEPNELQCILTHFTWKHADRDKRSARSPRISSRSDHESRRAGEVEDRPGFDRATATVE